MAMMDAGVPIKSAVAGVAMGLIMDEATGKYAVLSDIAGAEGRYFGFETLTFAPIDKTLVDVSLLNGEELRWWNEYHAKVLSIIAPQLDGDALAWAHEACAPLS